MVQRSPMTGSDGGTPGNRGLVTARAEKLGSWWQQGVDEGSEEDKRELQRHRQQLPVLFMFLKLPKLFNFHILRLAAECHESKGWRKETEKDKFKVLRWKRRLFQQVQSCSCGLFYLRPGPRQRLPSDSCSSSSCSSSCRSSGTTGWAPSLLPPPGRLVTETMG